MPAFSERAGAVRGRKVGPLTVGGWAAIVIATIVIVKLLRGGKSGSGTVTVPDAFTGDTSGSGSAGGSDGSVAPDATPGSSVLPTGVLPTGPTGVNSTWPGGASGPISIIPPPIRT